MTWHIYPTIGSTDSFRPGQLHSDDNELRIPIESPGVPNEIRSNRTWNVLDSHRLRVQNIAVELYWLAVAVYSADIRIPRSSAFDRWTRDITLYIPTSDVDLWQGKKELIQEFLSFLTGDHWTVCIRFRNAHRPGTKVRKWRKGRSLGSNVTVSLFSGGLDSFIGAVDALSNSRLALVGHYQEGLTKSLHSAPLSGV